MLAGRASDGSPVRANRAVGHNIARCALRADKDHSASKHSLGSKTKRSSSHLVFSLLYGQGFPVRWRNGRVTNRRGRTECPDRKSVWKGRRVSGRVIHGGRGSIKK